MSLNRRAFASVSLDCVIGSSPCTVDILEHYDVFAGGKKGRPTTTPQSLSIVNVIIVQISSELLSQKFSMLNMSSYALSVSLQYIPTYANDFK